MKSIKPGRGPSMMSGVMSIAVGAFGVIWTVIAASMGAGFMVPFGVIFIIIAVVQAVYNFKNATGENRYSAFDITENGEEPDPLNERFGAHRSETPQSGESRYCPYCGQKAEGDHAFCCRCGRKLP